MRRYLFLILSMGLLITLGLKGADVQKTETIEKTVAFLQSDQSGTVIVDNIYGDITILACTGNVVKATIEKTTEARSQIQFEKAVQEVILDISQEDGIIEFYVDGPFRCRHNNRRHSRWHPRKYKPSHHSAVQK